MMPAAILPFGSGLGSGLSILLGGTVALRLTCCIDLVRGLSAGVILGVAAFDLLPTAFTLGGGGSGIWVLLACAAAGFAGYALLDHAGHSGLYGVDRLRPHIGAGSLFLHSMVDGFMVGMGFDISIRVGIVIAGAILAHGLIHGINTVSLASAAGAPPRIVRRWVIADASGPLIGLGLTQLITVAPPTLAGLLAAVAGVFSYIGPWDLLPRRAVRGDLMVTPAFVSGFALIGLIMAVMG